MILAFLTTLLLLSTSITTLSSSSLLSFSLASSLLSISLSSEEEEDCENEEEFGRRRRRFGFLSESLFFSADLVTNESRFFLRYGMLFSWWMLECIMGINRTNEDAAIRGYFGNFFKILVCQCLISTSCRKTSQPVSQPSAYLNARKDSFEELTIFHVR